MPSKSRAAQRANIAAIDPIWEELRREAEEAVRSEPALGGFIYATILSKDRLEEAVCHRLAQRLNHSDVDAGLIAETFAQVLADRPELGRAFRADLAAVYDRDPACSRYIEPLLYFKGFHALVTHRFAHELYKQGRRDFALYLQSQSSRIFAVDINPAAKIGIGIMLDHGTGIVIGETAVIGNRVRIYQGVTLGAMSVRDRGAVGVKRHPTLEDDVVIYAGATILGGDTVIGKGAVIGGNCWVTASVPPGAVVTLDGTVREPG
jgi:serine O-acetyltransferase